MRDQPDNSVLAIARAPHEIVVRMGANDGEPSAGPDMGFARQGRRTWRILRHGGGSHGEAQQEGCIPCDLRLPRSLPSDSTGLTSIG